MSEARVFRKEEIAEALSLVMPSSHAAELAADLHRTPSVVLSEGLLDLLCDVSLDAERRVEELRRRRGARKSFDQVQLRGWSLEP